MTDTPVPTDDALDQLAWVRDSGLVNMMDVHGVEYLAQESAYYDLALFCAEVQALRVGRGTVWMGALNAMVDRSTQ